MDDMLIADTALIAQYLEVDHPLVRARAAISAGRAAERHGVPLLLRALSDADAHVRARAAFALGMTGDTSRAVKEALQQVALQTALAPAVEAVGALGQIGTPAARAVVHSLLASARLPDAVRNEALIVAWRFPRDSALIAQLAEWTRVSDGAARWRAAYSLARTGGYPAVAPLLHVVADPDYRVRSYAVRGLRAAFADSAQLRPRAFTALVAATRDEHPHVRINAVAQLPGYQNRDATGALIDRLLDEDANVRVAAAQALGQLRDRDAARSLAAAAHRDAAAGVRTAALTALAMVDTVGAARIATDWGNDSSWVMRMYAARVLAHVPWAAAAPALLQLARDAHYLVSAAALASIAAGDSVPDKRQIFIERLGAPHVLVRAAAARGLGQFATAADLDLLLQAYQHARQDATTEAAAAVVRALGHLRALNVPVAPSFFLRFGDHAAPPQPLYRLIAEHIGTPPATWQPRVPSAEPRPLEFYRDIVERYVRPAYAHTPERAPHAVISTPHGDIELELAASEAPLSVHNFITLTESGYYANTRWHRVVPNFVIQDGDPRGDGSGGPGYTIRDEINPIRYMRGILGMAHSGPHTGGGQWFITHSPQPHLDGGYTVFGRVVAGMDVVDRVVQEEPILSIRIVR